MSKILNNYCVCFAIPYFTLSLVSASCYCCKMNDYRLNFLILQINCLWCLLPSKLQTSFLLFLLLLSPRFTFLAAPPCDLSHIICCSESELRARTDYTQYVTVYGITDVSLSGSDVIQIGSQLRHTDTVAFGWCGGRFFFRLIIFHALLIFTINKFQEFSSVFTRIWKPLIQHTALFTLKV